jgi:small subunit ribosomal protein S5
VGIGKGRDVAGSIRKGVSYARRHLITVPMKGTTIPHEILHKHGAALVLMKPASPGAGLIAGGPVRAVVAAAGIRDIVAKMIGSRNATSNAYCAFEALKKLKPGEPKEVSDKQA